MSAGLGMLPWFPASFLASTRGWSVTEKGVYRELLDAQWDLGVLPADPAELQRLIGATDAEWRAGWAKCASKFALVDGCGLQNPRLEQHRQESQRLRAARVAAAERTNKGRAQRGADRSGERTAERDADRPAERNGERALSETLTGTSNLFSSPLQPLGDSETESCPQKRTVGREFHDQIIALYHELLPDLPRVKVWSQKRRGCLNARIRERVRDGKPADSIEYWRALFQSVAKTDFLMGRTREAFRCDLEWLITEGNFAKVIEGRYENRTRGAANGETHAR